MKVENDNSVIRSAEEVLNIILKEMDDIFAIKDNDFPNEDLYMDQMLNFFNDKLKYTLRTDCENEKILTKTMINNYAKSDLLPPPVKKKYSREHMMTLIFIYYFKSYLSINDIELLMRPVTEEYFDGNSSVSYEEIYDKVFNLGKKRIINLKRDINDKFDSCKELFDELPAEDAEYLQVFAYICLLSYDIFVKKLLVEQLIDELRK